MRIQSTRRWLHREHSLLIALAIGIFALLVFFVARSAGAAEKAETPAAASEAIAPNTLTMVVMDPLALPLSCPCVKGYAQRDYDKLGEKLAKELSRPVRVVYNESLTTALKNDAHGHADIVIGKHSVVLYDAKRSGQKLAPVASLTGKDGATMMTGLIVVPTPDPAKSVADLKGYHLIFGPEECDEKYKAAMALLQENGVSIPTKIETSPACSDGACQILDEVKKDANAHGAAVISSYAKPLLEGCGTVEKGSLRVVGETAPVPFVEAFVNQALSPADRTAVADAVRKSTDDLVLRLALETAGGFVSLSDDAKPATAIADSTKKK